MKTMFTHAIFPAQAITLVEEIVKKAAVLCEVTDRGFLYRPDKHSKDSEIWFPDKNCCLIIGREKKGVHTLLINVFTGNLLVYHEGNRSSFPKNALKFMPGSLWRKFNNIKDWELIEYDETGHPDLAAVAGFLW